MAASAALLVGLLAATALAAPPRRPAPAAAPKVSSPKVLVYERDVLPLFQARCGACHGAQPRAGVDIRTWGDLMQGGHQGSPVKPGAPEESLLYRTLKEGKMPVGGKLEPAELKLVADWIRGGARGATGAGGHWAFRPPVRPAVPVVKNQAQVRNPIDAFLLAKLEAKGLRFSPEASRRTLLRRVTFDLIGLPPTPEEIHAFEADTRPDAYERVVDRLLASPAYGERWARHWLDVAGYADSEGVLQEDRVRSNAWRYRDYVIRALNADKPYDQFIREQLAGDEMVDYRRAAKFTPELIDTLAATGFLRTAVDATRDDFNSHQYGEYQYRMLHDTETILGSAMLGLQLQCARCHDHKYEPISQKDYYAIQAVFTGGVRPRGTLLPTNRRQIVAATEADQKHAATVNAAVDVALAEVVKQDAALLREFRLRSLEASLPTVPEAERAPLLSAAQADAAKRTAEQKALVTKHQGLVEATPEVLAKAYPEFQKRQAELQSQRLAEIAKRIELPSIRAFYDQDATPPSTPLLTRGDWLHPADPVAPGVPAILNDPRQPFQTPTPAPEAQTTRRRTALADWIVRPDHPLTARVAVNRLWEYHFGVGIVATSDNFGRSGAAPSHPALLDWLATELTRGPGGAAPWTVKALHRLMVTSTAYRQASIPRADGIKLDPDDRLLWRQRSRRLEAEAVRDAMLAVTGTLDPRMFGDPTPLEVRAGGEIVPAGDETRGRRTLYVQVRRTQPVSLLNVFDAPVMETNCTRRVVSTTANQALALMNSTFAASQGRHFAARLLKDVPTATANPISPAVAIRAYELAFGRLPTPVENAATLDFLRAQIARYSALPAAQEGKSSAERAYADLGQALLSANEFVYLD